MNTVELLKTKIIYKGKEYYNFYIRLPNNRNLAVNFPMLYSDKFEKSTKGKIIDELVLIADDYEKAKK